MGGAWASEGPRTPDVGHSLGKRTGAQQETGGAASREPPQGDASTGGPGPPKLCPGQEWLTTICFQGPLSLEPRWRLRPGRAARFPGGAIPRIPRARLRPPPQAVQGLHLSFSVGPAPEPPDIAASGTRPDDSPRSRTKAGRRWPGRDMVRPEGGRPRGSVYTGKPGADSAWFSARGPTG